MAPSFGLAFKRVAFSPLNVGCSGLNPAFLLDWRDGVESLGVVMLAQDNVIL